MNEQNSVPENGTNPPVQPASSPAQPAPAQPAQSAQPGAAQPGAPQPGAAQSAQQPVRQAIPQSLGQPTYAPAGINSSAPTYAPAGTYQQPAPTSTSAMGITGFVLGVIAAFFSFWPIVNNASFFIAGLGLIFAIIGVCACVRGTRRGKGLSIAGLVICIVSIVIVLFTQSVYSAAIDEALNDSPKSSSSESGEVSESGTVSGADEAATSEYAVSIDECFVTTDYMGKPAAVVTYTFTNNSDEAKSFMVAINAQAFQNGVELSTTTISGSDAWENQMKEVKSGASITVQKAYELDDQENDLVVECTELISFNDSILASKTFEF